MRKSLICGLISLAVVGLCSCRSNNAPDGAKAVTFDLLGLSVATEQMAPRRAAQDYTPAEANMTDIWVMEGTQLLAHQTSADADFGSPTISLTYGDHSLTFIASGQSGQSVSNGVYTADKANDTYGAVHVLTVDAETAAQSVVASRACYGLRWTSTDAVPSGVATIRVTIGEYTQSLVAGLDGGTTAERVWNFNAASVVGNTVTATVYGFPEQNGVENDVTTTIAYLAADGSVISSKTKTVPVLSNRRTVISGAIMGSSASSALRVDTDWGEDYETSL